MHVGRRAREAFLVGANGDTFWHGYFFVGPLGSTVSLALRSCLSLGRRLAGRSAPSMSGRARRSHRPPAVRIAATLVLSSKDYQSVEHVRREPRRLLAFGLPPTLTLPIACLLHL